MPDTRREKAALQALHADNTAGDISAQDNRDGWESCHPAAVVQSAAFSSEPSTGRVTGDLFLPTDAGILERYSGSAWVPWGPVYKFTDPTAPSWSWLNQGSATITSGRRFEYLEGVADATDIVRARIKTLAASSNYTITACLMPRFYNNNSSGGFPNAGICLTDGTTTATSNVLIFGVYMQATLVGGTYQFYTRKYDDAATFNANGVFDADPVVMGGGLVWLRIQDNGTNRLFSFSADGRNFLQIGSESRTTFLTPTHAGFYCNSHAASHAPGVTLCSWDEI